MRNEFFRGAVVALLTAVFVTGCGGGGGAGAVAGIDRGGITVGSVTGFGSIFVNGVEYSTSGATIIVDDQPGTESDLRVGQIVRVEGSVDASGVRGTATRVTFADQVDGPVQSVDLAANRAVVLGQTVQVGAGTSFDSRINPAGLDGLAVGDRIEVSGTVAANGVIQATRIERKAASASVEVKGVVTSLDAPNRRFALGTLQVDYSGAQVNGFSGGAPVNGDSVEAVGTLNAGGTLVATRIERRTGGAPGASNDHANFEGLVTRFASAADFDVAGQRVTATATTSYVGGSAAALVLDAKVQVEGSFDASGRIVATKVSFRRDGDVQFDSQVEAVNAAARTLVVLETTVRTDLQTRFEDQSASHVQRFNLANLSVSDFVRVRAYNDGNGLLATRLERRDAQARTDVEGPATAVAQPNFTVSGVVITTDASTQFRNKDGVTLTASAFFAVVSGHTVKVRGTLVGNAVLAERAELVD